MKRIVSQQFRITESSRHKSYCENFKRHKTMGDIIEHLLHLKEGTDCFTSFETFNRIKFLKKGYLKLLEYSHMRYHMKHETEEENWKGIENIVKKKICKQSLDDFMKRHSILRDHRSCEF